MGKREVREREAEWSGDDDVVGCEREMHSRCFTGPRSQLRDWPGEQPLCIFDGVFFIPKGHLTPVDGKAGETQERTPTSKVAMQIGGPTRMSSLLPLH